MISGFCSWRSQMTEIKIILYKMKGVLLISFVKHFAIS